MRAGQSKTMSLWEATADTLASIVISVLAAFVIFPIFLGIFPTIWQNICSVLAFTFVGFLRKYLCRRVFNYLHIKGY